ncbi:SDR family NAD(P)-dependent oxidoreductase [Pseudomonas boanensis]|uniref:SDR family NAD(P)-dependent oxidoreductase n=1 Tax=Metapseudomonas boanensis TaxID=2822138 RepID=UPI0035D3FE87
MSRIWLTGGSSGIGAALAEILLEEGHQLALSARQIAPLQAIAERFPTQVLVAAGDINDRQHVAEIGRRIEHMWGALDLAILNAGTCEYLEPGRFDAELVERVVRTNLLGASHCVQVALPLLRRGERPHLAVVCSAVTWLALPRAGAYGASKAALRYLIESLRIDLAAEGIDVTLVSPGFVDTPLTHRNDFPMPMCWSAQRAARRIAAHLRKRPLEIAFPLPFILAIRLLGSFPARWRLALGRRLARPQQTD